MELITSESIYETLKREILNLTIKPGSEVSETAVCERFGVSRTPVRTAFQRLKDAGLIEVIPYKSTKATHLDYNEIEQLIYMRIAVETMIIRDFAKVVDSFTIEKIRYILQQQKVLLSSGAIEPERFYALDSSLHEVWFEYMHKEKLWNMIQNSQVSYTRFRILDIVESPDFEEVYQEHLKLFDAIQQKDFGSIESLISVHLSGNIKRLSERLETEFADYFVNFQEVESPVEVLGF